MLTVDGVPLHRPEAGWFYTGKSNHFLPAEFDVSSLRRAGRDGELTLPATRNAAPVKIVVGARESVASEVVSLLASAREVSPTAIPSRSATVTPLSVTSDPSGSGLVLVTALLQVDGAAWRDKLATTHTQALGSASVTVPVFAGTSAPIQDGVVRVKGSATGIQVTDSGGSWVTLPNVAAGQWVRFEMDTGRAFQTATDTWAGGSEVSGAVDFGGPRGVFEITSKMTPGDPSSRAGQVTFATATRSGAQVDVRARGAYLF